MCVIDKKAKLAIPFDSACEAVNYLSDKVDTVTIFAGIGGKSYNGKDVCYDLIKNKNSKFLHKNIRGHFSRHQIKTYSANACASAFCKDLLQCNPLIGVVLFSSSLY